MPPLRKNGFWNVSLFWSLPCLFDSNIIPFLCILYHSYIFSYVDIMNAVNRGVIVVVTTQCTRGYVGELLRWFWFYPVNSAVNLKQYATGQSLLEAGAISGHDMTVECAAIKLAYLMVFPLVLMCDDLFTRFYFRPGSWNTKGTSTRADGEESTRRVDQV